MRPPVRTRVPPPGHLRYSPVMRVRGLAYGCLFASILWAMIGLAGALVMALVGRW